MMSNLSCSYHRRATEQIARDRRKKTWQVPCWWNPCMTKYVDRQRRDPNPALVSNLLGIVSFLPCNRSTNPCDRPLCFYWRPRRKEKVDWSWKSKTRSSGLTMSMQPSSSGPEYLKRTLCRIMSAKYSFASLEVDVPRPMTKSHTCSNNWKQLFLCENCNCDVTFVVFDFPRFRVLSGS